MYEYKDIVSFVSMIDTLCEAILSSEKTEAREHIRLQENVYNSESNVNSLREIVERSSIIITPEFLKVNTVSVVVEAKAININNLLRDYASTLREIDKLNDAISCLMHDIPMTENVINETIGYIEQIESHECYNKWVKNSEKYMRKFALPKEPPEGLNTVLIENDLPQIFSIISSAAPLFQNSIIKLRYAYLYSIYRTTKDDPVIHEYSSSYLAQMKKTLEDLQRDLEFLTQFREKLHAEAVSLLQRYESELSRNRLLLGLV